MGTLILISNYNDCGLEEAAIKYLEAHPNYGKNIPLFSYRNGKIYTVEDVRNNVDGELNRLIRNTIITAIDLLTRGKRVLDM
jgi:hypothetical protein